MYESLKKNNMKNRMNGTPVTMTRKTTATTTKHPMQTTRIDTRPKPAPKAPSTKPTARQDMDTAERKKAEAAGKQKSSRQKQTVSDMKKKYPGIRDTAENRAGYEREMKKKK